MLSIISCQINWTLQAQEHMSASISRSQNTNSVKETSMITRQSIFITILFMIKKASLISNYFKITKGTVIKPTKLF